jgi:hypothetical protein
MAAGNNTVIPAKAGTHVVFALFERKIKMGPSFRWDDDVEARTRLP